MVGISTSTAEAFLDDTFTQGANMLLYVLGVIWPYLITVAIVYLFWRVGRSFFRG